MKTVLDLAALLFGGWSLWNWGYWRGRRAELRAVSAAVRTLDEAGVVAKLYERISAEERS